MRFRRIALGRPAGTSRRPLGPLRSPRERQWTVPDLGDPVTADDHSKRRRAPLYVPPVGLVKCTGGLCRRRFVSHRCTSGIGGFLGTKLPSAICRGIPSIRTIAPPTAVVEPYLRAAPGVRQGPPPLDEPGPLRSVAKPGRRRCGRWYNATLMRAELLTIGTELLSGATVNTNAAYLARRLAEVGVSCQRQVAVGDERAGLMEALRDALGRCDVLLATGGLGPTFDDVTMEIIAQVTHRPLTYRPRVAAAVRRFYAQRHRRLQRAALRQAFVPRGGVALPNPLGTAPGLWLRLPTMLLIALPGVPSEMRAIMERHVLPRLRRHTGRLAIESRTLRTVGVVELSIERLIRRLLVPEGVQIGLYPQSRLVDVRLTATASSAAGARRALGGLEPKLREGLGAAVYGTGEQTLEEVVGQLLRRKRRTLAIAESCTGGLLSDRITNVPGSSRYLRGTVVAYHNDLKRERLAVPAATLARFGSVSGPVARAMAQGVRRFADADVGLAVTGIAGPSGTTRSKPAGLVYLGLADRHVARSVRCRFPGDRLAVKLQAAQTALDWLRRHLLEL